MLTNEGERVLSWVERNEGLSKTIMCYSCGLEPEYHGGLCGDCLLDRNLILD